MWNQRVYSASSSKAAEQLLPQKRRTLSSGLSQYQHAPLGGRLKRAGTAAVPAAVATDAATDAATRGSGTLWSGKLSCVVSKITPLPHVRRTSAARQ